MVYYKLSKKRKFDIAFYKNGMIYVFCFCCIVFVVYIKMPSESSCELNIAPHKFIKCGTNDTHTYLIMNFTLSAFANISMNE